MSSKILVPLDGSGWAEQALPCAVMLARGLPSELLLLHAVSLPVDITSFFKRDSDTSDALLEKLEAEAQGYLQGVARRLEEKGVRVDSVVQHGPPAEVIVDYAEGADIQQIVMATHGYSGISRWRHGSVAERVLQSASVPLLLVGPGETKPGDAEAPKQCRRMLVPLDGSSVAEQVLPQASAIARALGSEVILFRVPVVYASGSLIGDWYLPLDGLFETAQEDALDYLEEVASRLQAQGIKVSVAVDSGGVADAIIGFAEANHIDLIGMCTHGRTGLIRWTLGSVADRVLRAASVPLLLVRAQS